MVSRHAAPVSYLKNHLVTYDNNDKREKRQVRWMLQDRTTPFIQLPLSD